MLLLSRPDGSTIIREDVYSLTECIDAVQILLNDCKRNINSFRFDRHSPVRNAQEGQREIVWGLNVALGFRNLYKREVLSELDDLIREMFFYCYELSLFIRRERADT